MTENFLLQLMLILLAARLVGEVAARLGAPAVLGELLAGLILGPSLLGWIHPNEVLQLLAEIGIILLLFEVGLESDIDKLVDAGGRALIVALGGFFCPLLLGLGMGLWLFDMSMLVALFLGGTLTATSIGITVRILNDLKRQQSVVGQVVLGAAVVDDLMGVVLLAILYEFAREGSFSIVNATQVLAYVLMFFVLAPVAARAVSALIRRLDDRAASPGLIPTTIVSLVLLFSWLAELVGAPELLGGFAAGLALSRRFFLPFGLAIRSDPAFSARILQQMKPVIQLFTPIFFVMVGLSLDLSSVVWSDLFIWLFSLTVLVAAIVGKFCGAVILRENWPTRIAIGMAMVPRGEVGLIFAELGRFAGVFDSSTHAAVVIVIAYTTLLAPFWIKQFYNRYGHLTR